MIVAGNNTLSIFSVIGPYNISFANRKQAQFSKSQGAKDIDRRRVHTPPPREEYGDADHKMLQSTEGVATIRGDGK